MKNHTTGLLIGKDTYVENAQLCVNEDTPVSRHEIRIGDIMIRKVEVFVDKGPDLEVRTPREVVFDGDPITDTEAPLIVLPAEYKQEIKNAALGSLRQLLKEWKPNQFST